MSNVNVTKRVINCWSMREQPEIVCPFHLSSTQSTVSLSLLPSLHWLPLLRRTDYHIHGLSSMTEETLGSPAIMDDEKKPLLDFIPPPSPTKPQAVDIKLEDTLFSASSPPPAHIASSSRSRSPSRSRSRSPSTALSATKRSNGVKKEKSPPSGPILIPDLPIAWDEAHETFETLEKCVYERKDLGLSRESDEMMVCDCSFNKRE
jgi:hypothetical protein